MASGRICDLFEGTALELPRDEGGNDVYDVHPAGQRIAFVHDPSTAPLLANRLTLSEIDLRTRRVRPLVDDAAWDFAGPRYSPDGRRIAVAAAHVGRHHTANTQLAMVEPGQAWRVLAPDWDRSINLPLRWAADGQAFYCAAEDRGRCHLWRLTSTPIPWPWRTKAAGCRASMSPRMCWRWRPTAPCTRRPLEPASLRRRGPGHRAAQLSPLQRLRMGFQTQLDRPPRRANCRTSKPPPTDCCSSAGPMRSASAPPAAAMVASWWRG